jgi:hypothetical protein
VQLPPFSCYFISLGSKYSLQTPVLIHPQSISFPESVFKNQDLIRQRRCRIQITARRPATLTEVFRSFHSPKLELLPSSASITASE